MSAKDCFFCEWVRNMPQKEAHRVVAELKASWLVLSASQAYRGYCLLICKTHAEEVFQLPERERARFMEDIAQASQAIYNAFKPDKLNYEILGNQTPHVHCHIIPRRNSDPVDKQYPIWGQRAEEPRMSHHDYRALAEQILGELEKISGKRKVPKTVRIVRKPSRRLTKRARSKQ